MFNQNFALVLIETVSACVFVCICVYVVCHSAAGKTVFLVVTTACLALNQVQFIVLIKGYKYKTKNAENPDVSEVTLYMTLTVASFAT